MNTTPLINYNLAFLCIKEENTIKEIRNERMTTMPEMDTRTSGNADKSTGAATRSFPKPK